jgi:hypothetical protein
VFEPVHSRDGCDTLPHRFAATTGRTRSEVIREAIDQYLQRLGPQDRLARLRVGRGMWCGRKGIDLSRIRQEFDRF